MLELKEVCTSYGEIQALFDISLEVNDGEIVSIIGANGAGKSTLLNAISGLNVPDSGKILYNKDMINGIKPYELTKMGIIQVPEGRHVFPDMTVEENLNMGAYVVKDKNSAKHSKERVFDLFPRLKERRKQLAGTMSGGEQQMLAIGRALMAEPEVLMLDEPSMGLAPIMVESVFEKIEEINKQGTTILLVEQNAFTALQISNRGYVIETGHVTLTGTGDELIHDDRVRKAYLGEE